jgi:hypothetical protein
MTSLRSSKEGEDTFGRYQKRGWQRWVTEATRE